MHFLNKVKEVHFKLQEGGYSPQSNMLFVMTLGQEPDRGLS